ncbi:MAG: hypothetical protein J5802_05370 [Butyrivibrio sp.]|nr:hypothetical protein [Butyrivibrio sp.]
MKKRTLFGILCVLLLVGCGDSMFPDLPDDAIAFVGKEYLDKGRSFDHYFSEFEYNGRKYVDYGDFEGFFHKKDIDKCIGYIPQPDGSTNVRMYTLTEDKECNFLLTYEVNSKELMNPGVLRAVDTMGKDIDIPKHVFPADYCERIWK